VCGCGPCSCYVVVVVVFVIVVVFVVVVVGPCSLHLLLEKGDDVISTSRAVSSLMFLSTA